MVYMKTMYAILSRERGDWLLSKNHTSASYFGEKSRPWLYVRNDDSTLPEYREYADKYKCMLHVFDAKKLGIEFVSQTYDLIISHAIENGSDRLFMTDDDISFMTVNPILGAKPDYSHCSPMEFEYFLDRMANMVDSRLVAIAPQRIESRSQAHIINFNAPARVSVMYNVDHFKKHPMHRYWQGREIEAHCDSNLSLRLLTSGFMTANLNTVFTSTAMNNPGGCSTYRTSEWQERATQKLHDNYPEVTRLKQKKGWGDDKEGWYLGITCYWKKAFNKELFMEIFGHDPTDHARHLIKVMQADYAEHIRRMRDADDRH